MEQRDVSLVSWRMEGSEELDAKLQELIKSLRNEVVEPILLDAAKTIRDGVKVLAPLGPTGNLKKSIVAKSLKQLGIAPRAALAGVNYRIAPHAHLVEFGHGGPHPAPPHPFFRPVWDGNKEEIKKEIINQFEKAIDGAVRK